MNIMDKAEINSVINQVYELEGLLTLARDSHQDPKVLHSLIVEKCDTISRQVAQWSSSDCSTPQNDTIQADDHSLADATLYEAELDADEDDTTPPQTPEIGTATKIAPLSLSGPSLRPALRRLFPLNEIFLYRRELFNGSDVDFNASLRIVEELPTYEDAEDYFINDLQWNRDDKNVTSFLDIIKKYYRR